jgi:hypothetical protein
MQVRPGAYQLKGSTLLLPCFWFTWGSGILLLPCFDRVSITVCHYCQLCQCQVSSEMPYVNCYHCHPLRCR